MTNTVYAEGYLNYSLPIDETRNLDLWLEEHYGIACLEAPDDADRYLQEVPLKEIKRVDTLRRRIGEQKALPTKADVEVANIYAKSPWREMWHSKRRAWVLDSISFASAVGELIQAQGSCESHLDVGCHVGFLPTYLSEHLKFESTGIDIAGEAISEAKKLDKTTNVDFLKHSASDLVGKRTFQFVTAVDLVQPNQLSFSKTMKSVCDLVAPNGHLVVIGNYVNDGKSLNFYQELGLSCKRGQLTGGFHHGLESHGFPEWDTKVAYHFRKQKEIESIDQPISGDQYEFSEYANSGDFPPRELNRSYFLARQLQACSGS